MDAEFREALQDAANWLEMNGKAQLEMPGHAPSGRKFLRNAAVLRAYLDRLPEKPEWKSQAELAKERDAGWIHFHPEDFCQRCGGRNITPWFAKSELWNRVAPRDVIWCPQCFVKIYEQTTDEKPCWELTIEVPEEMAFREAAMKAWAFRMDVEARVAEVGAGQAMKESQIAYLPADDAYRALVAKREGK